jgi:hypothetical protein
MAGDGRGWPAEVPPDTGDGRGYRRMDEMAATGGRLRRWPVMIGDGGDGW